MLIFFINKEINVISLIQVNKSNINYIVAVSDFAKSTQTVWLIVDTCAFPLLSELIIFKDEILARWYATTVFKLKNLKKNFFNKYDMQQWYM